MRSPLPLLLLLALPGPAEAGVRRFAVLVGNNEGSPGMHHLYFAEDDARKMQQVLTSVGSYENGDVRVLLGADRDMVMRALAGVRGDVALARQRGDETLFLLYYSGHADAEKLQLGRTFLTWPLLEDLVSRTGADVRLAFVDACQSGSLTGAKGGTRGPGFVKELDERLGAEGQVVITSSSRDEASQESDEIGGSYFTHFLASALLGAADEDGDTRVTLAETYRYVYHETVFRTSGTRTGVQHPTYAWELAGKGDVVLSDLSPARSALWFPPGLEGTYAVFDEGRRMFVAEVDAGPAGRALTVRPGAYLVQIRRPSHLAVARADLRDAQRLDVGGLRFEAVEYEEDVARGTIERRKREEDLPALGLRLLLGTRRFGNEEVDASYLPATPAGGVGVRWHWRDGRWAAADLVSGALGTHLSFTDLDWEVPVIVSSTTVGGWFGIATRPARVQAGAGLGLGVAYFRRDFPNGVLEAQDLLTVAPGLAGFAGWHPGRLQFGLEIRLAWLPVRLDDREQGLGFSDAFLTLGYRF